MAYFCATLLLQGVWVFFEIFERELVYYRPVLVAGASA